MNPAQLHQDFLPTDLVLQLVRDMAPDQYPEKIALVEAHAAKVVAQYDPEVLAIRLHNEIGFIYWDAGRWEDAIFHYEKVTAALKPGDHPFLYFHVACTMIQCHRHLENYPAALACAGQALEVIDQANSPFQSLTVLKEYVLTLEAAGQSFDTRHIPLLDHIHATLQFPPLQATDPIGKVKEMNELNRLWNRRLSSIQIESQTPEAKRAALRDFAATCPIGWYQDHVKDQFLNHEIF